MVERHFAPEDARLLDHLYDLAGCADDAFASDILAAFLDSSAESLHALDDAFAERNLAYVARVAHRLRSSFSTLGMQEGVEACAALEQAALSGDAESVSRIGDEVRFLRQREATRVARLLRSLRRGHV